MPLISINSVESSSRYKIGIWQIDESEEELKQMCIDCKVDENLFDRVDAFKSNQRRVETLATHLILYLLTGRSGLLVSHSDNGSPHVDGLNISISHTKGYAAVIISEYAAVGIDIEYISNRVEKATDWFIRSDEYAKNLIDKIVQWCGKEAAYKYLPNPDTSFLNLISNYDEHSLERGAYSIKNSSDEKEIKIMVYANDFFVLTFTVG